MGASPFASVIRLAGTVACTLVLALPALLFWWAVAWWFVGGLTQMDRAELGLGAWRFAAVCCADNVSAPAERGYRFPIRPGSFAQPLAFSALVNGFAGGCPSCGRRISAAW